jgi:hypothetical protein
MTVKDTDSIQRLSVSFNKNRQAFWLKDHSIDRAFPGRPSGQIRLSSPNTAMAGLRWILTIFPFNGTGGPELIPVPHLS